MARQFYSGNLTSTVAFILILLDIFYQNLLLKGKTVLLQKKISSEVQQNHIVFKLYQPI